MVSSDLIREARRRAGLTQADLGRRVGKPQSVIGRWERGQVKPSFETVLALVRACGLELSFRLTNYDDSYLSQINRQLELTPAERVHRMAAVAAELRKVRERVRRAA